MSEEIKSKQWNFLRAKATGYDDHIAYFDEEVTAEQALLEYAQREIIYPGEYFVFLENSF
jgi:hypothetical protein